MDLRESIARQTDFALHLTRHVSAKAKDAGANLAFSPLSLHVVLSLVAAGAKGQTLQQLTSFLRASPDGGGAKELAALAPQIVGLVLTDGAPVGGPKVAFANGVWVEKAFKLKGPFEKLAAEGYKAQIKSVDFQTKAAEVAAEVNSWVDKETSGLVKDLLPAGSVDSSTRLVLGNALYFKGAWAEKFDASETKNHDFYLIDGKSTQVPFMTSQNKQFLSSFKGFKVLRLPYKQGEDRRQYSMYILLPDSNDGLWGLAEKLGSESDFLERHAPVEKVSVGDFRVPKFKISFGLEASTLFKGLGLDMPFGGEGDLSEIVDSASGQNLYISSIFHKAFVEFNEEGTEAAAASAAVIKLRSLAMPPMDFVADHPFLFIIREDMTGVVLFSGHILNPSLIG